MGCDLSGENHVKCWWHQKSVTTSNASIGFVPLLTRAGTSHVNPKDFLVHRCAGLEDIHVLSSGDKLQSASALSVLRDQERLGKDC